MKKTSHHYAAILGVQNNVVNHDWAAVFGNAITSVATNTLHVECLNAVNTPIGTAGPFPPGTIFYSATPVLPVGATGFLMIW